MKCYGKGDWSLKCRITRKCHSSKKRSDFLDFALLIVLNVGILFLDFLFCAENWKNKVTRSMKVPAVSNKLADIQEDEFSWRKYVQMPIKGSPHSSIRGLQSMAILHFKGLNPRRIAGSLLAYGGLTKVKLHSSL